MNTKQTVKEAPELWKTIYATIAYALAGAELEEKPQSDGIGKATETIYEMWQQGQSQYPVQSEAEERVYYKSLTTQAERIAYIKGTKFGSQWKQDQSGWIEAWTPPNDSRYVRVLVDGKHNIHPHFYMAGEWFDNLGAFPVDLKISHWKDFDDLAPESK